MIRSLKPSLWTILHLILLCISNRILADSPPFIADQAYDAGHFGSYPVQTFKSSDLIAPRPNVLRSSPFCENDIYTFLAPRGHALNSTPMILDAQQTLKWATREYDNVYNFKVQDYEGEPHITFWAGADQVRGHGSGNYFILNSSYQEVRNISAGNGLTGDLHEFLITQNGTALLTVYHPETADLTSVGGLHDGGWIYASSFQEIDLKTNEVLFQWRANDHVNFTETYRDVGEEGTQETPWDWFHINSLEKDPKGNFLISARYTHSLSYLDGRTGEVLWVLGGKNNSFKDLSDGKATNFAGQHDARWHEDYTAITLFDNAGDYENQFADQSRGMRIKLDFENMTATLVTEYFNPGRLFSSSQASMQVLPNDNVLLGYGFIGAFTEFKAWGECVCDVHFEAASAFNSGDVQSYRVYKSPWKGLPKFEPSIAIEGGTAYVSWNGATEVHTWAVHAVDRSWGAYGSRKVQEAKNEGFETAIKLDWNNIWEKRIRVAALDGYSKELGVTRTVDHREESTQARNRKVKEVALRIYDQKSAIGGASIVVILAVWFLRKKQPWCMIDWRRAYQYRLLPQATTGPMTNSTRQ